MEKRKYTHWVNPTAEVINGKLVKTKSYNAWTAMMDRCKKNGKYQQRKPTYIGCCVCDEWHNYDIFFEWYNEHYRDGYALDKDILVKENKLYSPNTCSFVPKEINLLFTKRDKSRGSMPIGVCLKKSTKKYMAQCSINKGVQKHLGYFDTPQQAFQTYKQYKESLIKELAEEYYTKGLIEDRVYQAMINYEVEIDD